MEFRQNQSIYLQIAEHVCENILTGRWEEGVRIPSIREFSVSIEVNPNTVTRSYRYLQEQEIIFNQRGIGYFVAEGAYQRTHALKKESFIERELPQIFKTMDLLKLGFDDLKQLYVSREEIS